MSKRRITFSKLNMGKYISHLDLLRCFTRAIHRSGLPVVYSQGFNPHQKMTFSLPLPVGVTSQCETVDIQFQDSVSDAEILEKLQANLPMDIKALSVGDPFPNAADITSALYIMTTEFKGNLSQDILEKFFNEPEILVMKKTKKGEKSVNLKDYIRSFEIEKLTDSYVTLNVVLAAGGQQNLKPDILTNAMAQYIDNVEFDDWDIHRKEIYFM